MTRPPAERPPRVWLVVDGPRVLVKGRGIGTWLKARGFHPFWITRLRAWVVETPDLPDIVAHLQHHNIPHDVTETTR